MFISANSTAGTTFLARYSQRRGGARVYVARKTTLTAEGYHEPQERARGEVKGPRNSKKSSRATRESGFEILARQSSKDSV